MKKPFMQFRQTYVLLRDVWELYQRYAVCSLTDKEIQEFQAEVENLRLKNEGFPFAVDILIALANEIARIEKSRNHVGGQGGK